MDNRRILQDSVDYIEANLKADITAQELADRAGFSLFHYYRLFQQAVGMPVGQYITRRRLLHAIGAIGNGCRMIEAALEYGFDTHAGFYKAFVREFGCSPSSFLKKYRIRRAKAPNLMQEEPIMMTHKQIGEVLRHWNMEKASVSDVCYYGTGEEKRECTLRR